MMTNMIKGLASVVNEEKAAANNSKGGINEQ
jgi:hypothetical protein